ncbi:hypothetical protein COLINT_02978 [Collinsella intestinalis DSM 13280]|uniref:Uncharacterized protein n=1 Tax=Collinsella intestinalis DSM 13280 TaxID=521003 RepID=C4FA86_9ACTN|nr:hypothetical protein COLINT_02978 [Collinsella intestinalis DSM 13280]
MRFFVLDFENAEYADKRQFCDLVFYPRKAGATRQNQNRVRKSSICLFGRQRVRFASVKSWDESASLVRRAAAILVKRAGNGEDTRELARILHCCPIRPLDAGERGNAVGLVVGLDVGLHVVANAGAPLGGGGIYRV